MRQSREVVIVGAGLVGSLLAVYLVRRGFEVTVYERGPDVRGLTARGGRSINLVLTHRGIHALERVGLADGAMRLTVRVMGRMMHSVDGELSYQPYGKDESECNYSISRRALNQYLVDRAETQGVRFRFEHELLHMDREGPTLTFRDGAGQERRVEATVCFGADGGGSAVRTSMESMPGFEESAVLMEHGYKELTIPVEPGETLEQHALHIWPRGAIMLMALPNLDRSFTVTLYLPFHGPSSFQELEQGGVERLFAEQFPDSVPLLPGLVANYRENPLGKLGTVRCYPWNDGGKVLLIGDAAHAIVPFFGQGMNCGFEDCRVLDDLMQRDESGDWAGIFEAFGKRRKPNADAIAHMALENFVEMSDRVGDPAFLLRKAVEHRLEQEMPREYRSRYSMVMYSRIPYRLCFRAGEVHREILDELCRGLESPEELDLDVAREIVGRKLTPFLKSQGIRLDY